jgi:DNA-binding NtrC family response regulator
VRVGCLAVSILFGAASVEETSSLPTLAPVTSISLDDRLKEVESNLIGWALKVADGNKSKAAELLNIKRSTLGDRIIRCGITEPRTEAEDAPVPA